MSGIIESLIRDAELERLDPLHQEALSAWFGSEVLKRILIRSDPEFATMRARDVARLALSLAEEREEDGTVNSPPGPVEPGPAYLEESQRLTDEIRQGPLRWIADPASDEATYPQQAPPLSRL